MNELLVHPVCPRCGLPALRLVLADKACDWCRDQSEITDKPYVAANWPSTVRRIDTRIAEIAERAAAQMEERTCRQCGCTFMAAPISKATMCGADCLTESKRRQRRPPREAA